MSVRKRNRYRSSEPAATPLTISSMVKTVKKRMPLLPVSTSPTEDFSTSPQQAVLIAIDFNDHRGLATLLKSTNHLSYIDEDGNNLLIRALSKTSSECAGLLIKHGIATDVQNKRNETPLHWSCLFGMEEITQQLIKQQADINATNAHGFTPLHCAVCSGSSTIVAMLLKEKVKIDAMAIDGITPLILAASIGKKKTLGQMLLHTGALSTSFDRYKRSAINFAAENGNYALVNELLNHRASLRNKTEKGETPLHSAVQSKCKATTKHILKYHKQFSVNAVNNSGYTALHNAVLRGDQEMLSLFMACPSVDLRAKCNGWTVLDIACAYGYMGCVDALSFLLQDNDPQPLHLSIQSRNLPMVLYLINRTKAIEFLDGITEKRKDSALHILSRLGEKSDMGTIMRELLQYPVDINRKNYKGFTPLHTACLHGNVQCVKQLLAHAQCNPYEVDHVGRNGLHYAVLSESESIVDVLLQLDVSKLFIADREGNTPLHLASSIAVVQSLLSIPSIDTYALNKNRKSPLECFVDITNFAIAFLLLRHRQQYNPTPPPKFVARGINVTHLLPYINPKVWKSSLDSCPLLSQLSNYQAINHHGMTPLLVAAKRGEIRSVKYLLSLPSVRVNHQDNRGWSALHFAAAFGHSECIHVLLQARGDPLLIDKRGRTPLHVCQYSAPCLYELLAEHGAEQCRIIDNKGLLPLHYACCAGNIEVVNILLHVVSFSQPEDIEVYLQRGTASPLHVSCHYGYENIVLYLLEKIPHLSVNLPDPIHHDTPLMIAIRQRHKSIVRCLLSNAKINFANVNGTTPLHLASECGNFEILQILIERNANVGILDHNNELPLHKAVKNGHKECAEALVSANSPVIESLPVSDKMSLILSTAGKGYAMLCLQSLYIGTAHLEIKDSENRGILHHAAISGNLHTVAVIIHRMGNEIVNRKDVHDKTALHYAVQHNHLHVVAFLVGIGGDINAVCSKFGNTPLHYAIEYPAIYHFLTHHGALDNARNKEGLTPKDMIARKRRGLRPRAMSKNQPAPVLKSTASGWVSAKIESKKTENDEKQTLAPSRSPFTQSFLRVNPPTRVQTVEQIPVSRNENNLCKAIIKGDAEAFTKYLGKQKKNLNFRDENGDTPLVLAVLAKNLQFVSDLLLAQANPNVNCENGMNALFTAIEHNSKQCISLFLMHGADPNVLVGEDSETVLTLAAARGDAKLVHQLISFNATVDSQHGVMGHSALYVAAQNGHVNVIRALLKHGASVNIISKRNFLSPLHAACIAGKIDCVRFLLNSNAQVDLRTVQQCTPLHIAVGRDGFSDVCQILVAHKANVNAVDDDLISPLHLACMLGCPQDAQVLLQHGARSDLADKSGAKPIHHAAESGNVQLLETLVHVGTNKMDLLAVDSNKRTPLHIACIQGHVEAAAFLHRLYLMMEVANKEGVVILQDEAEKIPLYYAIQNNHPDIVATFLGIRTEVRRQSIMSRSTELLQSPRAFFRMAVDCDGSTVLHKLISYGLYDCIEIALGKEPNIEARDSQEETLLLLACRQGDPKIIRLLLSQKANYSACNVNGCTVLQLAIQSGSLKVFQELLEQVPACASMCNTKDQSHLYHWIAESSNSSELLQVLSQHSLELPEIHQVNANGMSALTLACKHGNLPVIQFLLDHKADVHVKDSDHYTPLLRAAESGSIASIALLLRHGAQTGDRNEQGQTALHCACIGGNYDTVEYLLKELDAKETDHAGNTLLHLAVTSGALHICKLIPESIPIDQVNAQGQTALHIAAQQSKHFIIEFLLKKNASTDITDHNGNTALHLSATKDLSRGISLLLKAKANPLIINHEGNMVLHIAAMNGHIAAVEELLRADIPVTEPNRSGMTPLHLAASSNVLSLLLSNHPEAASLTDHQNRYPLHVVVATIEGDSSALTPLIQKAPQAINALSRSLKTPLHYATIAGNSAYVQLLLDEGAEMDLQDENGFTALHYAVLLNHLECVELLLDAGANIDLTCSVLSRSPLHIATSRGNIVLLRLLLDYGANANLKDRNGDSSLHLAVYHACEDSIELLIQHQANLTSLNRKGMTPLEVSLSMRTQRKMGDIVYSFFKFGYPLDYINPFGFHFIHLCSFVGMKNWVAMEIALGVDKDLPDRNGMTPVMHAALGGHQALIEWLHSHGANFMHVTPANQNCLHFAVQSGNLDVVRWVLEKVSELETLADHEGKTPLHYAVATGHYEISQILLRGVASRGGEPLTKPDVLGAYPIHWASFICSSSLYQELQNRGCSVTVTTERKKWNILHAALSGRSFDVLQEEEQNRRESFVLDVVSSPEGNALCLSDTTTKETVIHLAARLGQSKCLEICLNTEIQNRMDDSNLFGCSALHFAVMSLSESCVSILLKRGVNVNAKDEKGNTPLMKALTFSQSAPSACIPIIQQLVEHKNINLRACNKYGESVLHFAGRYGNKEVVKRIVTCKDGLKDFLTCRTQEGASVLHYIAYGGNIELLEFAMSLGADITATDNCGGHLLFYCVFGDCVGMLEYLVNKYGGKLPLTDVCEYENLGNMTLHQVAALLGRVNCVRFLVQYSEESRIGHEESLLHLAAKSGCYQCIIYLLHQNGTHKTSVNANNQTVFDIIRNECFTSNENK